MNESRLEAKRMQNAPLSKIREVIDYAEQLEKQGREIIHLEIGEPDFDTPQNIVDAAKVALDEKKVHYGPVTGIASLRESIVHDAFKKYQIEYDSSEVLITHGVAHGIFLALMAYLDPGDEILVPSPGYLCYFVVPNIAGAKAVPYPLTQDNHYQINIEEIEPLITTKTKAILLNSPLNPSGMILNKRSLENVLQLAEKYDLLIISDEIYAEMTYGGKKFYSMASLPDAKKRTIVLNGFSKYYAMTGWRIGYILCDQSLMDPMMRLSFYSISCPNTFVQYAAQAALDEDDSESKQMLQEYETRRNYLVQALNQLPKCHCTMPDGAFYVFLNIKETGMTSDFFCKYMLETVGVAMIPGCVFGENGEGFVRISYSNSLENLKKAVKLMYNALDKYLK